MGEQEAEEVEEEGLGDRHHLDEAGGQLGSCTGMIV